MLEDNLATERNLNVFIAFNVGFKQVLLGLKPWLISFDLFRTKRWHFDLLVVHLEVASGQHNEQRVAVVLAAL